MEKCIGFVYKYASIPGSSDVKTRASVRPWKMGEDTGQRKATCACCTGLLVISLIVLCSTAGGMSFPPGGDLSRCRFSSTDAPYSYPGQPLATSDPPYSQLFQHVCIDVGTERQTPQSDYGERNATYACACCGQKLFGGETKFDSGTGWPSFWAPYDAASMGYSRDGMNIELHCANCKAHLGHVFPWATSAANPLGLRYCIDGVCIRKRTRAADETGGAYTHNPAILPELVTMVLGLTFLGCCVMVPVTGYLMVIDWWTSRRHVGTVTGARHANEGASNKPPVAPVVESPRLREPAPQPITAA